MRYHLLALVLLVEVRYYARNRQFAMRGEREGDGPELEERVSSEHGAQEYTIGSQRPSNLNQRPCDPTSFSSKFRRERRGDGPGRSFTQ